MSFEHFDDDHITALGENLFHTIDALTCNFNTYTGCCPYIFTELVDVCAYRPHQASESYQAKPRNDSY